MDIITLLFWFRWKINRYHLQISDQILPSLFNFGNVAVGILGLICEERTACRMQILVDIFL